MLKDTALLMNTLRLILALPVVIILAYLSLRLTNKYIYQRNQGKSIQVLERIPLNSKNSLCVIRIGEEYIVASVTESSFQVVKNIGPTEAEAYRTVSQELNFNSALKTNLKKYIKGKIKHE